MQFCRILEYSGLKYLIHTQQPSHDKQTSKHNHFSYTLFVTPDSFVCISTSSHELIVAERLKSGCQPHQSQVWFMHFPPPVSFSGFNPAILPNTVAVPIHFCTSVCVLVFSFSPFQLSFSWAASCHRPSLFWQASTFSFVTHTPHSVQYQTFHQAAKLPFTQATSDSTNTAPQEPFRIPIPVVRITKCLHLFIQMIFTE